MWINHGEFLKDLVCKIDKQNTRMSSRKEEIDSLEAMNLVADLVKYLR